MSHTTYETILLLPNYEWQQPHLENNLYRVDSEVTCGYVTKQQLFREFRELGKCLVT